MLYFHLINSTTIAKEDYHPSNINIKRELLNAVLMGNKPTQKNAQHKRCFALKKPKCLESMKSVWIRKYYHVIRVIIPLCNVYACLQVPPWKLLDIANHSSIWFACGVMALHTVLRQMSEIYYMDKCLCF